MDRTTKLCSLTWIALALALPACDDNEAVDGPAATSGTTGSGSSSTSSTSSGAADESSSSSGGPSGPPQCTKACAFPGDCCPPGSEGMCPSMVYPYAFQCIDDLCVVPPCTADAECGAGGACMTIDGVPTCVTACSSDAECSGLGPTGACTAMADDGSSYCFAPCTESSCGNAECDAESGQCTCVNSSQCIVGYECV